MGMSLAVPTPGPSLIHLLRGSTLTNCCQFHSFFHSYVCFYHQHVYDVWYSPLYGSLCARYCSVAANACISTRFQCRVLVAVVAVMLLFLDNSHDTCSLLV